MGFRVALHQTKPVAGDREANLAAIAAGVRGLSADVDLHIFPELATSGYAIASRESAFAVAESAGSEALASLAALADEEDSAIVLGLPYAEGGRLYNASALLRPGSAPAIYRKLHLFHREPKLFDPGDRPPSVWEWRGVRLGMMICFDWIFPETARLLAIAGADLIVHPSNLVLRYCQDAMRTRAIENGVFAATVNRVGEETYADGETLRFSGSSQLVDPLGERLCSAGTAATGVDVVEIEPALARDKRLPSGNDRLAERRPGLYGKLTEEWP